MTETGRICVGAIAGAFGVKGEVRLKSFCTDLMDIGNYGALWSEDGATSFDIKIIGPIKNGLSVRIDGIRYKDQADALKGVRVFADRDALPSLPDDEFYHADLIGMDVFDTGGKRLGRITAVHDHGAGDILEVVGPEMKEPVLLPFTQVSVPTVDMAARKVVADPPEGAF